MAYTSVVVVGRRDTIHTNISNAIISASIKPGTVPTISTYDVTSDSLVAVITTEDDDNTFPPVTIKNSDGDELFNSAATRGYVQITDGTDVATIVSAYGSVRITENALTTNSILYAKDPDDFFGGNPIAGKLATADNSPSLDGLNGLVTHALLSGRKDANTTIGITALDSTHNAIHVAPTDGTVLQYGENYIGEVARGKISGRSTLEKFGRNTDIDIGTEDVWDNGGEWEPFTNGEQTCNIVSTDVDDDGDPADTGARTLKITGISGGAITSETITLNGQTNVVTDNAYTIIYRMEVLTVGSTGSNEGIITAKGTTDTGETISSIGVGHNQTRMAIAQVPTTGQGEIYSYYITLNAGTPATTIIVVEVKEKKNVADSPWVTKHIEVYNSSITDHIEHFFQVRKIISAGSFVKISVTTDKNDTDISAGFDMLCVDD